MTASDIENLMTEFRNEKEAKHLMRFFKCGIGEYGEGDRFLGIRVPVTREIVKKHRNEIDLDNALKLTASPWHEIRLAGFLFMIELYKVAVKNKDKTKKQEIINAYLSVIDRGNNWDLVDLVAPKLLGEWLVEEPSERYVLYDFSNESGKLWHQRVAIVATFALMRNGEFDETFDIALKYLNHKHDLIHKATGWMLREAGKRGALPKLYDFLNCHAHNMPRTMLRYAIEKLPEQQRQQYMKK